MTRNRTIFLVAALLLATAGTAAAQGGTVSFSATSGTVKEGVAANAAGAFQVKVTRSPVTLSGVTFTTTPALASVGATVAVNGTASTGAITFPANRTEVTLTITQGAETAQNWLDETLTLALRAPAGTRIGPDLVLTLDDAQGQPTVAFTADPLVRLTETTRLHTHIKVTVPVSDPVLNLSAFTENGSAGTNAATRVSMGIHRLRFRVEPPNAIGTPQPDGRVVFNGPIQFHVGMGELPPGQEVNMSIPVSGMAGVYSLPVTVAQGAAPAEAPRSIEVAARRDTTGFKNQTFRFTPLDLPVKSGANLAVNHGTVKGGPAMVVEVKSDEPIPTVSFSPTDISIKEGGSTTAVIIAAGALGEEVGMVDIAPDGDALVDLYRGKTKLAPKGGIIRLDMKDTNVVRLTARSTSDRSLLDGQMKQKTWRIVDADGANIDTDANTWTVTVEGSTAVPALPLVAQLLLALLLTAGGARLYRRRGRGGLLALLAAAALLGPAAGSAEAQTVSFSQTTGTVVEGAAADKRFQVTVTSTGADTSLGAIQLIANPAFRGLSNGIATNGVIFVSATPPLSGSHPAVTVAANAANRNRVVLTIYQDEEGTPGSAASSNWNDEKTTLALRAAAGTAIGPDLVLTTDDNEAQPTVHVGNVASSTPYRPNPLQIYEGTAGEARALITFPAGTAANNRPSLTGFDTASPAVTGPHRLRLKVEPPDGIGTWTGNATNPLTPGPLRVHLWGATRCPTATTTRSSVGTGESCMNPITGMPGVYSVNTTPREAFDYGDSSTSRFEFTARKDTTGFRNPMIKLSFLPLPVRTNAGTHGTIAAGPPLVIEILSDEPVPTVSFSPTDISIKEGGSTTMALISEGPTGSEVNTVKLRASGDAVVGLFRDDKIVAPLDGVVTVSLKDTNVARLTVRSKSDPSLLDGQMKTASWTIIDADGAKIDPDAGTFTVTVTGSTAVPALPLVAQLLLALFLTAGGARLYRRRQGSDIS